VKRTNLAAGLGGAVELAAGKADTAHHRTNLTGVIVDGDERALDCGWLLEP
jgi:hypothetical protein